MDILFPKDNHTKYYKTHYRYLLNILQEMDCNIAFQDLPFIDGGRFIFYLNDVQVLVDFSDHVDTYQGIGAYPVCFKYHYSKQHHSKYKNIVPFSPISFYDWNNYTSLEKNILYNCRGSQIISNQRPYADALGRRNKVQRLLKSKYGGILITRKYSQQDYWKMINSCLTSVFVPGARNDMIDRGHLQYMAFGCCTISPRITDVLSYYKNLIPEIHYIMCKDDYSDLTEKIEYVRKNKERVIEIGKNVKQLFKETSTPERLYSWIVTNLEKRSLI